MFPAESCQLMPSDIKVQSAAPTPRHVERNFAIKLVSKHYCGFGFQSWKRRKGKFPILRGEVGWHRRLSNLHLELVYYQLLIGIRCAHVTRKRKTPKTVGFIREMEMETSEKRNRPEMIINRLNESTNRFSFSWSSKYETGWLLKSLTTVWRSSAELSNENCLASARRIHGNCLHCKPHKQASRQQSKARCLTGARWIEWSFRMFYKVTFHHFP